MALTPEAPATIPVPTARTAVPSGTVPTPVATTPETPATIPVPS